MRQSGLCRNSTCLLWLIPPSEVITCLTLSSDQVQWLHNGDVMCCLLVRLASGCGGFIPHVLFYFPVDNCIGAVCDPNLQRAMCHFVINGRPFLK